MLSNKLKFFLMTVFWVFQCCKAESLVCPEKIETASTLTSDVIDWKSVSVPSKSYFYQISIVAGPPQKQATLVPNTDNETEVSWILWKGEENWMVCRYLYSDIILSKRILNNESDKKCTVKIKRPGRVRNQENELTCEDY